ncbi:luciferin 4-monooxygenase [Chironomus tepperi]|uniref:luciferin 4-monooxygenase n=1 Tax=Chironomus tepperi TaxID=113505 RepID=UPI00391F4CA7
MAKKNILYCPEITNDYANELSMGHLIIKSLTNAGDKVLLVSGITSEELTAKELLTKAINFAQSLKSFGIKSGDVVSLVCENRFEFAYVLFGSILANVTVAPINLTYSEREMSHALSLSKPKMLFMSPFAADKVVNVSKSLDFIQKVVLIDDENPFGSDVMLFDDFLKRSDNVNIKDFIPSPIENKQSTVSLILCSSGTTGLPKGVQLSQANLIVVTRFCKDVVINMGNIPSNEERVCLGLLPWFHAFGITILTGVISGAMARIVLLPKFEEALFLSCIEYNKCNILFLVPPLMVFLAKHPMVADYDLSSARVIICGAAPLSKETENAVYDRLKIKDLRILQGYGMSELSLAVLLQKSIRKPGSVGDLNGGSYAKVINENGEALGPNERGELCFKGNQLMIGYINDKDATSSCIDNEGWLHTGDVGYYDDDKQFFIVDRIKELIKWKGFQVPPAEIEAILLTHPKIKDAAVIGIPDERAGEKALAYVVRVDESLTENDVLEYVAKTTSPAKRLHGGVIFTELIPKNPSGKILRRELREFYKQSNLKAKL